MSTFNVINSNDSGQGSLREAIALANLNSGKDDIFVQSDVQINSHIEITDSLNIGTPYGATITGSGEHRIFNVYSRDKENIDVTLYRLNLENGSASFGGSILSSADLNLVDTKISQSKGIQGAGIYQINGSLYIERSSIDAIVPISNSSGGLYTNIEPEIVNSDIYIETTDSIDSLKLANASIDSTDNSIITNQLTEDDFLLIPPNPKVMEILANEPVEVYQFKNELTDTYFYTIDKQEKEYIEENLNNFVFQGVNFYAFASDVDNLYTVPIYRAFDPQLGIHSFSKESMGDEATLNSGDNGVAFYVLDL